MINKIKNFLKEEYVNGYKPFDYIFLGILIITQIITFIIYPDSPISIIAGILGTIATVLCAKGKITYYVYGFIQTFLFIIIDWQAHLYIDTLEQCFYFITMFYGVYCWKKNLNKTEEDESQIVAKKMSFKVWITVVITVALLTGAVGFIGAKFGSAQAYTDAFSNILALFAQLMCVMCYKEQWLFWLIIDIADIKMYAFAHNYVIAIMYVGWSLNCIYGWYNWNKTIKENEKQNK